MNIELSPEEFRRLGYQAIELIAEQLERVYTAPTRQPVPDEVREGLIHQSLPDEGTPVEALFERLMEDVLPYPMGNSSPRFMGWVNSPPAPLGVLAELLAAGLNPSVAGGDHAATYVEHTVLNWMRELMGFPASSGAVLVSGGSVANLVCLGAMRHAATDGADRAKGLNTLTKQMVVYTSTQGHGCIQKAVELLGIGSDYLRKIPVDSEYQMDVQALREQITTDRAAGLRPVCVTASAGTVNTGAIDPLNAIADVCAAEGLWFHVDGAYGGIGILAEQTGRLYGGIDRADSIALDQHKWMYMPVECGCALVKDGQLMRDTYSLVPAYLRDDRALPWFSEFGIQQTRGFRALKLWMVMQQIGVQGYRELISRDIRLTRAMEAKIKARSDFELVATGPLSVVCFRYCPSGVDDVDALNRALVPIVMKNGRAFLTNTELQGRPVLRACIVNFRTTEADLDELLEAVAEAAKEVV